METFTFSRLQLEQFALNMFNIGMIGCREILGNEADYITRSAAKKKFKSALLRWEKAKLITAVKQVGVIKYKRSELEILSRADELHNKFLS